MMLIIKNAKLIDFLTEGYEGETADILCDGERIVKIAPVGTDFGAKAQVFDAAGKTVMPGLIDLHVHLLYENIANMARSVSVPECAINEVRYAQELLNDGYTTIRDVGDSPCKAAMYVRNAINQGKIKGPRMTTSGPILTSNFTTFDALYTFACGPIGFRDTARKLLAEGADFIKLYGSGSLILPSNEPGYPILESDEIEAAVKIAKLNATYASVHGHGKTAIDMCVRAGVHTIEHASLISEETLNYIDETGQDTALVYTLFATDEVLQAPETYNGKRLWALWDQIQASLKNAYHNHKGILIGWGSDVSLNTFRKDPMREFRLRKEYIEMSNEDILKQATINSAKIIYKDSQIGSIKEGKFADFVVIDGDPVADISVMYTVPAHVIKGGEVIR